MVCFEERPCQLIGDVRDPLPMKPGCIERFELRSTSGEASAGFVLMSFEPLGSWRELVVTERRRKQEFALAMRRLAEEHYPQAEKIRVVLDNLSTHTDWCGLLRELPGGACPETGPKDRVCLHPGSRLMAEHGGG